MRRTCHDHCRQRYWKVLILPGHCVSSTSERRTSRLPGFGGIKSTDCPWIDECCLCGKAFHLGEHSHEELTAAFDQTLANWNLYLFDGFGSYDPDVIYNRIEYLASGLDCKIIFLDHLSILLSVDWTETSDE